MRAVYKTPRRACVWCAALFAAALVPMAGAQQPQTVYVCAPGSGADTCVPSDSGVEQPECTYDNLEAALGQLSTNANLEIVLRGPRTSTCFADTAGPEVIYTLSGGRDVPNGATLTIRGDNLARRLPYKIVIEGAGPSPMFLVKPNGTLVLEGVTLRGGGSSAILTQTGGAQGETESVTLNRVLIRDFAVNGITLGNGATATITNSIFYRNQTGVHIGSGATANIAFSTFLENRGAGVEVVAGAQKAEIWGCLFYQNAGPAVSSLVANLLSVTVASCLSLENAGDFLGAINLREPVTDVLPEFLKPELTRRFPGEVQFPIHGTDILRTGPDGSLPAIFGAPSRDFDFDLRNNQSDPQVGADIASGSQLNIEWLETEYLIEGPHGFYDGTFYVGRGANVVVRIWSGSAEDLGAATVIARPETAVPGDGIRLPRRGGVVMGDEQHYADYPLRVTGTSLEGYLLDGRLTINVESRGSLLGYGGIIDDAMRVTQLALDTSQLVVIDTVPPVLELAADATARAVYMNSTDTSTGALDRGLRMGEAAWPPQTVAVPSNAAPLLAVAGGAVPKLFFDYANAAPLEFTVRVTFRDPDPEGLPEGFVIEKAGFISFQDVDPEFSRVQTVEDLGPDPEHPLPFWVTNVAGDFPENLPARRIAFGDSEGMDVVWTISGVPPLFDRYWKTTFQPAALDRAFNVSDASRMNAVELWWMPPSGTRVTSGPLGGTTNSAPSFAFGLERPPGASAPAGASPCDPIYSVRLWQAQGPDPATATWRAIGPWSPYGRATQFAPAQDTLAQFTDSYLAVTVRGADEAGNVQPVGAGAQDVVAGLAAFDADGLGYDFWYNPGSSASLIDTVVQAEFFYDANLNAEFDPAVDVRLGSGPRLPWNADVPLRVQFLVNFRTFSTQAFINWALFQDGIQVVSDVAFSTTGSGVFALPPGALPALGDEKRTVNYRFVAYVSGGGPDPSAVESVDRTPAVKTFSVYPPGEAPTGGEDQPILVFERE